MKENRQLELSVLFAFLLAVIVSISGFESECGGIRDKVLRLHVIANSDSAEDQQLKLAVRDAVLEKGKNIFGADGTKNAAEEKNPPQPGPRFRRRLKKQCVKAAFATRLRVEITKTRFPTRSYESFTLPAGVYDAVRVVIGSGEGKNWWCVMFPPLCLPAAKKDVRPEDVFDSSELRLVQSDPKIEIRFWIVEKLEKLKAR